MRTAYLIPILAVIAAVLCIAASPSSSADDVDNDQGTVTYYTYTVNFQFKGTDAQSILWEFGFDDADGNPVTSTEWNPSGIVYPAKGTYTVTQTVSNSVGSFVSQLNIRIMGTPEVVFESNGGSSVPGQTVKVGSKVIEPSEPEKEGYKFEGWYKDPSLLNVYDFSQTVSQHMTLYAKWTSSANAIDTSSDDGSPKDDGNNGGDDKESENSTNSDSSDISGSLVSILIALFGGIAAVIGHKKESRALSYIGLAALAIGAIFLFSGFDVIDSLSIGKVDL